MKVYISADIEGICGICDWNEADKAHADYPEFRERMTEHVAAACAAALESGAREVLVKDAHGSGRNLLAAELPPPTRLVRGWSGHPFGMVQELDDSYDAAMFVGYHARAGAGGNPLAHTWSSSTIAEFRVNGEPVSEFRLHAWVAASVGVPVVLVSGDEELCAEVAAVNEAIVAVPVLFGHGASTASLHPEVALANLDKGVRAALGRDLDVCRVAPPESFSVEIVYKDARNAYRKSWYPGAKLETATSVAFEATEILEVMRLVQFAV